MSRRRERSNVRVSEHDVGAVIELLVRELDCGAGRQVRGCARGLDERGQAGDVIRLHVRLEDGDDRRTGALRLGDIAIDERLVRIDDRELLEGQAAEDVRGARGRLVQERTEDHVADATASRLIALDEVTDTCYRSSE
jgi:hypothetical protein